MNDLENAITRTGSALYKADGGIDATAADSSQNDRVIPGLVKLALDAHGGYGRWKQFNKVTAKVVSGGFLWGMKGIDIDETPRRMTSAFRNQWTRTEPFGEAEWHMIYTPERVVIESQTGEIVAEQQNPRDTFAGHDWETPWTPLQLAYFNGYAMWTYYNLPFLLGEPGFTFTEIPPIDQDGLLLSGLKVRFPQNVHSHSPEQNLYFEENGLLRRQDYQVDVAGGASAGHLISDYIDVQGLKFPTRRRVFMRNANGSLQYDKMPVSIDLVDFEIS
ncbi:MAG: hypothetical protein H7070_00665 [Saprospiraceae bacterium]|nr:hypothetical protein [Pyrinomonadaceae bacterium]